MSDNKTQDAAQAETPKTKAEEETRPVRRGIKTGIKAGRHMCW